MQQLTKTFISKTVKAVYRTMRKKPDGVEVRFSELMNDTFHQKDFYQSERCGPWVVVYDEFSLWHRDLWKLRGYFIAYMEEKAEFIYENRFAGMKIGCDVPWIVRRKID